MPAAHLSGGDSVAVPVGRQVVQESTLRPEPQGGLEKFLEQYVVPAPMPGLAMRLLEPAPESEVFDQRPSDSGERAGRQEPVASAPAPQTAPPQPPSLDINAIAERVYQTLRRREQLERERRGLS